MAERRAEQREGGKNNFYGDTRRHGGRFVTLPAPGAFLIYSLVPSLSPGRSEYNPRESRPDSSRRSSSASAMLSPTMRIIVRCGVSFQIFLNAIFSLFPSSFPLFSFSLSFSLFSDLWFVLLNGNSDSRDTPIHEIITFRR